ncbi:stalk domain-containing protein [Paenibacillus mesophilus]|uniref:stalk domain-containing protein n=1 Tax=Paenibacillus mesophilus TaxID=2582849 RepID=UPI0013053A26|nr:stalk domain-containing protein [Paenibacillus mesophilus]
MRKTIMLTIAMGIVFTSGVYAKDTLERVDAYLRPDFKVEVNGKSVKDATPLIYEGSSYLPFKSIGELLGATVSWDEDKKVIKLAMPVQTQPETGTGTTSPSTGGNAGAGTGTGTGTGTSTPAPIDPPKVEVPEQITLDTPIRYNFVHENKSYPTLTNLYKGTVYMRWKDIKDIPINVGTPKLSKEKLTEEQYVHVDLIKPYWSDRVKGDLNPYAIIEGGGTISESKLKALNDYFGTYETGLTIKPMEAENEYEVLTQGTDKWFVTYKLRFWQQSDGKWNVSNIGWKSYPKETTTP